MKPLIGITADILPPKSDWGAPVCGQNVRYIDAVVAAGGLPVLLPPLEDTDMIRELFGKIDGFLFSGGGDIDPALYGDRPINDLRDVRRNRDDAEIALMKLAVTHDKPVLAICRGHQVLNVALGGTLYQDLPIQVGSTVNHDISTEKKDGTHIAHHLTIDAGSHLAGIVGETIATNSHHHQAVRKVAPGLHVTSRSEDGVVESIELPSRRFAIGVQFHPESLAPLNAQWRKLFASFVREAGSHPLIDSVRSSSRTKVSGAV